MQALYYDSNLGESGKGHDSAFYSCEFKGAKTSKLPESFLGRVFMGGSKRVPELPFYGIYNVDTEEGFFSADWLA